MNVVALDGYCITDPDIKQAGDTRVARFRFAVKFAGPKKTGEKGRDDGIWSVEAWGKQADFVEKYVIKGGGVSISGQLQLDKWEKDGASHEKTIINAREVGFPPKGAERQASTETAASTEGTTATQAEYDPYNV